MAELLNVFTVGTVRAVIAYVTNVKRNFFEQD